MSSAYSMAIYWFRQTIPRMLVCCRKWESLAHVPVKVTPHRTLNSSKGVVRSRELASCDVAEILTELKLQGRTDAVIISVREGSNAPVSCRFWTKNLHDLQRQWNKHRIQPTHSVNERTSAIYKCNPRTMLQECSKFMVITVVAFVITQQSTWRKVLVQFRLTHLI